MGTWEAGKQQHPCHERNPVGFAQLLKEKKDIVNISKA
jgi:hypothetical protein